MFHSNVDTHGIVQTNSEAHTIELVVPYSNCSDFNSRLRLHRECVAELKKLPGARVWVVEVALAERPFIVTRSDNPHHVQLRTNDILWHKENMMNVCVRHIATKYPNYRYVGFVDGDIFFQNKNVALETIRQLQTHPVVQMFASVVNMGPDGQVIDFHHSFCHTYAKNGYKTHDCNGYTGKNGHPGFCWAFTRKAFNDLGGLIDWAILGSADFHMCKAFVGEALTSLDKRTSHAYRRRVKHWQERAQRVVKGNIGYVDGTILHGFHGRFANRKYVERWQILFDCNFDPDNDIKYDEHGLLMYDHPDPRLPLMIKHYFEQRNEDSIDL
jgi:hypothetical protein